MNFFLQWHMAIPNALIRNVYSVRHFGILSFDVTTHYLPLVVTASLSKGNISEKATIKVYSEAFPLSHLDLVIMELTL